LALLALFLVFAAGVLVGLLVAPEEEDLAEAPSEAAPPGEVAEATRACRRAVRIATRLEALQHRALDALLTGIRTEGPEVSAGVTERLQGVRARIRTLRQSWREQSRICRSL
jgi:hypothetical protein